MSRDDQPGRGEMTDNDSAAGALPLYPSRRSILWSAIAISIMVVCAVGVYFLVTAYGAQLQAPTAVVSDSTVAATTPTPSVLLHILIALAAVIATGMVLSKLFAYIGQPPVIGEVVAGIVLGPSLLGPDISALILPRAAAPTLGVISQIGVILYMFIIGLELHSDKLKERAPALVAISQTSIVVPFILGCIFALFLYPRLSTSDVPFASFTLFLGVAMSITAFPVLARILSDKQLTRTELGVIALSCAATGDVTAWCLLAFVVGVAKAEIGDGLMVAAGTVAYITVMIVLVKPLLGRLISSWQGEQLPRSAVAFVFVTLLLSALATEAIGIHAIFGAFILGAVIPANSVVARVFTRQLGPIVTVLLLPAFFAYTGMRTRIDLISGWDQWLILGGIIVLATVGKFGGTFAAARVTGHDWRQSAALGTLMNTRGLMELIVLNIGLELHVISPTLFSMMVLMAVVTTMLASPLLRLLVPEARDAVNAAPDALEKRRTP
jgi:Kef-type K+ transport system membrane component KefB